MADDFQSILTRLHNCQSGELCDSKGYIDTYMESWGDYGPVKAHGDVYLCGCGCVSLSQLEGESIARLKGTNKVETGIYNSDLQLLNAVKRKKNEY